MRVTSAFISSLLFASAVLADDWGSEDSYFYGGSHDTKSMAGAIYSGDPGTFHSIKASIRVPEHISGLPHSYAIAWVGIDSSACNGSIFRGGVFMEIDDNNYQHFRAFVQWHPDHFSFLDEVPVYHGDLIQFELSSPTSLIPGAATPNPPTSLTSGQAHVINLVTGEDVYVTFTGHHALCGQDVQWAISPATRDDGQTYLPLPHFGKVTFEDAAASGPGRTLRPEQGAKAVNIVQYNEVRTWVAFGNAAVTVHYVP